MKSSRAILSNVSRNAIGFRNNIYNYGKWLSRRAISPRVESKKISQNEERSSLEISIYYEKYSDKMRHLKVKVRIS